MTQSPGAKPLEDKPVVYLPPAQKSVAMVLIMCATVVVMLDQTIANVALPHMQAALGATPDTVSWVLTSYILATAVGMPMTGWLAGRIGRIRLFGLSIVGFTISSAICGLAVSLPMMVAARVAQGFCGAFLVPMSQAFAYDMNAPSQQMRAITIWGLGVMVAPILGPALGGYLTDAFDWRWVFFINVPIGAAAAAGIFLVMPHFPAARRSFDRIGFAIIVAALCGLQLALDRGTQQDWFESPEIIIELGVALSALWMLVFHLRRHPHAIIPAQLFSDANFVVAIILAMVVTPIITAGAALLPPLIQVLMGYPVFTAGILLMPRGIAMVFAMLLGGRLMRFLDGRLLIAGGLVLLALSLWLQTRFDLEMGNDLIIWAGILQGAGVGLAVLTTNYLAVSTLPIALRTDGAAVYNLMRNVGTSLMIAVMTALLARNLQINHAEIGSHVHSSSTPYMLSAIFGGAYASDRVAAFVDAEVTRQAMMVSYINDFWAMMWLALAMLPLLLFLKPIRIARGEAVEIGE